METRSKKRLGKKPLPEDRQGMPGADAGHDSIQTIGDSDLSRRDAVGEPENSTADNSTREPGRNRATQHHAAQNNTNPAMDVLWVQPTTTKAGKQRQRMQWSEDMNKAVMHCYYTATKMETIASGYRTELHRMFTTQYPELKSRITEQRLIDQKRTIIKNHRIPLHELQAIKEAVAIKLAKQTEQDTQNTMNIQNQRQDQQHDNAEHNTHIEIQPVETQSTVQQETGQQTRESTTRTDTQQTNTIQIQTTLQMNINIWKDSDPTRRTRIPKLIYKKETADIINTINNTLTQHMDENTTLQDIHMIIYAAAITTIQCNRQRTPTETLSSEQNTKNKHKKPKWQIRLEQNIHKLRKDIGRLTQATKGNTSKNITKHVDTLINKNNYNYTIDQMLDTLKQKLAVYAARLKRYNESNRRKQENRTFKNNEKTFYRKLNTTQKEKETAQPTKEEITTFWTKTWSNQTEHNRNATWIAEEEQRHANTPEQPRYKITENELAQTIRNTQNWKHPGSDNIQNFWYKKFTSTHPYLTQQINKIIENPSEFPKFLTEGITYLKPKNQQTEDPANYRPITCLQTLYKIITGTICKQIEEHLTQHKIIAEEQKGSKRNSQGCKEQLVIDTIVTRQATKQQRNLHTCYIDYRKAFDTIPHTWLQEILRIYKINTQTRTILTQIMNTWRTKIELRTTANVIQTDEIKINRGIFQGDTLSALWFCMCLNPLTTILNRTTHGYNIRNNRQNQYTLNHLMYMDDIKLYAATEKQLDELLQTTDKFTSDIKMEFGITKCKTLHIQRGQWTANNTQRTLQNETLQNLQKHETYKYLGFEQNTRINHTEIKQHIQQQYKFRLTQLLKTKLNSRNLTKAINTYAVPILTYSFGIINWTTTDLDNTNRITRTQLTKYQKLHPKSCKERLTISREEGGRGLIDLQALYNKQIQGLRHYFHNRDTELHKAITQADKNYTPLNLALQNHPIDNYKENQYTQNKIDTWANKQLHGKHYYITRNENVDKKDTYAWLRNGTVFPETEGFLFAIQDQVIATKNYIKYIIRDNSIQDDRCRKCNLTSETIEHIVGGCKLLAGTEYTDRHNTAAKIIHKAIANRYKLEHIITPYYKYTPTTIIENEKYKLYWDTTLHTDKTVKYNRPDITFMNKEERTTYLIDISIPNDTNTIHKYREKIEKYTPLAQEIQRIWKQQKIHIIPFIISVTGITPKNFKQHLAQLQLHPTIHGEIQKAIILKTCNITRQFLNTT